MYKDFYGGYHDGAVAADNDYSSGKVDFNGCPADGHSHEYCKGYEAGYNDEGTFYLYVNESVVPSNNPLLGLAGVLKQSLTKWNGSQQIIVRKVKFILGPDVVLDLGKLCSQFVCVTSFIISKLPCSSTSEIVSLVCLCLNENFRCAPKLKEGIVLLYHKG